jgi:hypothetical protein
MPVGDLVGIAHVDHEEPIIRVESSEEFLGRNLRDEITSRHN